MSYRHPKLVESTGTISSRATSFFREHPPGRLTLGMHKLKNACCRSVITLVLHAEDDGAVYIYFMVNDGIAQKDVFRAEMHDHVSYCYCHAACWPAGCALKRILTSSISSRLL